MAWEKGWYLTSSIILSLKPFKRIHLQFQSLGWEMSLKQYLKRYCTKSTSPNAVTDCLSQDEMPIFSPLSIRYLDWPLPSQSLLSYGASPDYRDAKGLTPLYHTAIMGDDPGACITLLRYRAEIGVKDQGGWSELHHVSVTWLVQYHYMSLWITITHIHKTPSLWVLALRFYKIIAIIVSWHNMYSNSIISLPLFNVCTKLREVDGGNVMMYWSSADQQVWSYSTCRAVHSL